MCIRTVFRGSSTHEALHGDDDDRICICRGDGAYRRGGAGSADCTAAHAVDDHDDTFDDRSNADGHARPDAAVADDRARLDSADYAEYGDDTEGHDGSMCSGGHGNRHDAAANPPRHGHVDDVHRPGHDDGEQHAEHHGSGNDDFRDHTELHDVIDNVDESGCGNTGSSRNVRRGGAAGTVHAGHGARRDDGAPGHGRHSRAGNVEHTHWALTFVASGSSRTSA